MGTQPEGCGRRWQGGEGERVLRAHAQSISSPYCGGGYRLATATIWCPCATHFIMAYVLSLPPETRATTRCTFAGGGALQGAPLLGGAALGGKAGTANGCSLGTLAKSPNVGRGPWASSIAAATATRGLGPCAVAPVAPRAIDAPLSSSSRSASTDCSKLSSSAISCLSEACLEYIYTLMRRYI